MVAFDTPINANDQSWQRVVQQPLPLLLYLFNRPDAQLDEAFRRAAREHAGKLLVVRVNANDNPQIHAQYQRPPLPALIAIRGGAVESTAAPAQVGDVTAHAAYLLGQGPKPAASAPPTDAGPVAVTDSSFQSEVLGSDLPVLVDFWAPWCGPCHMLAPVVERVARKYAGRLKVVKLNIDENPQTASRYQTMSIPTLILFHRQGVAGRLVGVQPQPVIEQMIESTLRQ